MSSYAQFAHQLRTAGIAVTPAELHGFLSGLICGGVADQSWQPLLYQFTNNDEAYPIAILKEAEQIHRQINNQLGDIDGFNFELWLPDENITIFAQADALSEWVNNFLLGLGLAQPKLDQERNEIGEAVDDLKDICQLGYDDKDDQEELTEALEEIIEYVRTIATIFYSHFRPEPQQKPVLH
ncbi:YecA family protein [Cricetibacter osteomyelitidis]|uniref:YecA/YgfB family protein n=1 Tax=Cricetibacter osteomyelitidis TaxID=1521931 RepID=UPI001A9FE086|nr:YecA family protein [Cricetibacter osteomyelitidis]